MHPNIANLTFGVEFEVIVPHALNREEVCRLVSQTAGLTVSNGSSSLRTAWKVVYDGSLAASNGHGLEIVSPVLTGEAGLDQVRKIANALTSIGATANQTCGFHVHVGAGGQPVEFFKTLAKLYGRYENAIDQIMPASRRGNANAYCRSITTRLARVDQARTVSEVISVVNASRYHKLNLTALHKHSTVEFRQHSGTVDSSRAVNWVVTCLKLVAAAHEGKTGEGAAVAIARDFASFAAKTRAVLEMVGRPQGATRAEVMEAHNFGTISVERHARLAGIALRSVRDRATHKPRFFLVAPTATNGAADIPATLDGLADLIGASDDERAYYRNRAHALR